MIERKKNTLRCFNAISSFLVRVAEVTKTCKTHVIFEHPNYEAMRITRKGRL